VRRGKHCGRANNSSAKSSIWYQASFGRWGPMVNRLVSVRAALRQKRDYVVAYRILLADGTIKYLESNGHHVYSAGGELLEVMGTSVDVTERKRAEQALRESEGKFPRLRRNCLRLGLGNRFALQIHAAARECVWKRDANVKTPRTSIFCWKPAFAVGCPLCGCRPRAARQLRQRSAHLTGTRHPRNDESRSLQ
jgi:PAS domain-containing protein